MNSSGAGPRGEDAPFAALVLETLVAHDSGDTFDRREETHAQPIADILWLAMRGNSTARRVFAATMRELVDQVMAERWPGQRRSELRADSTVRLYREVQQRMLANTERHAWRWN